MQHKHPALGWPRACLVEVCSFGVTIGRPSGTWRLGQDQPRVWPWRGGQLPGPTINTEFALAQAFGHHTLLRPFMPTFLEALAWHMLRVAVETSKLGISSLEFILLGNTELGLRAGHGVRPVKMAVKGLPVKG